MGPSMRESIFADRFIDGLRKWYKTATRNLEEKRSYTLSSPSTDRWASFLSSEENLSAVSKERGHKFMLEIVFQEGGNELCISSYSIGLTYALPYIGLLEHLPWLFKHQTTWLFKHQTTWLFKLVHKFLMYMYLISAWIHE